MGRSNHNPVTHAGGRVWEASVVLSYSLPNFHGFFIVMPEEVIGLV